MGYNRDDEGERVYARAGFGAAVERGSQPALVVVDLGRGFTEAEWATGSDLSAEVGATRSPLRRARLLHHDRLRPGDEERIAWVRKAPGLAILADRLHGLGVDTVEQKYADVISLGDAVAYLSTTTVAADLSGGTR